MSLENADELERQRADRAFWDYYHLPADKRTLSELMRVYKEQSKLGEQPPSRRRETLTRWRTEGDWDGRCAELEKRQAAEDASFHHATRQSRLNQLNDYSEAAVNTLHRLAKGGNPGDEKVPASVQLQAAEAILDRVGLSRKGKNAGVEPVSPEPVAPLPPNADQITQLEHYNNLKKSWG